VGKIIFDETKRKFENLRNAFWAVLKVFLTIRLIKLFQS
jgi:hypothetical protein